MSIRINPYNVTEDDIPEFKKVPPEKAQRKLNEIRCGAEMLQEYAPFPPNRPWQDVTFAVAFLALCAAILGSAVYYSNYYVNASSAFFNSVHAPEIAQGDCTAVCAGGIPDELPAGCYVVDGECMAKKPLSLWALTGAGVSGASGAVFAAFLYTFMCHRMPGCVVYTSLFVGPCLMIVAGFGIMAPGTSLMVMMGGLMVILGVCNLACVYCCWRHLIPFTIQLTMAVASVIEEHPSVIFVSLIGGVLSTVWTMACSVTFYGVYVTSINPDLDLNGRGDQLDRNSGEPSMQGADYALIFLCSMIFVWGSQVAFNICHTTYCGVFGRWYYRATQQDATVMPSLKVALTTSYGSICLGGLLVAFVRALEAVVRQVQQDAQEDGNMVLCCVLALVQCVIDCVGDILEYFNEWAYVQCAIRGVQFCEAARITYSLCTCANMMYIVQSLLTNSLVFLGSIACAAVGSLCGAFTGYLMSNAGQFDLMAGGAILGFFVGCLAGACAVGVINSGVKTLLVCWAENPDVLAVTHPELHMAFNEKIKEALGGGYF